MGKEMFQEKAGSLDQGSKNNAILCEILCLSMTLRSKSILMPLQAEHCGYDEQHQEFADTLRESLGNALGA